MKYIVYASTNTSGSQCETEMEIDGDLLDCMSDEERAEYLQNEAMDAAWDAGIVSVWYEAVAPHDPADCGPCDDHADTQRDADRAEQQLDGAQ